MHCFSSSSSFPFFSHERKAHSHSHHGGRAPLRQVAEAPRARGRVQGPCRIMDRRDEERQKRRRRPTKSRRRSSFPSSRSRRLAATTLRLRPLQLHGTRSRSSKGGKRLELKGEQRGSFFVVLSLSESRRRFSFAAAAAAAARIDGALVLPSLLSSSLPPLLLSPLFQSLSPIPSSLIDSS